MQRGCRRRQNKRAEADRLSRWLGAGGIRCPDVSDKGEVWICDWIRLVIRFFGAGCADGLDKGEVHSLVWAWYVIGYTG